MSLEEQAREFAKNAHVGQTRKLTNESYFTHLEGVASILRSAGLPEEVVSAGYLHDVVEDTNVSLDDIRALFGGYVAELVDGNTEDKNLSWEERKQHTVDSIVNASFHLKLLIGADKLDNLNSMIQAYEQHGDEIWSHFKRGRNKQIWYYSSLSEKLLATTGNQSPLYFYELADKVKLLRNMV